MAYVSQPYSPVPTLLVGDANDKSNACRARGTPGFIVRCISA